MQITNITVSYSRVQSLGNYSNVKSGASLTATVEDEDDFDEVERILVMLAKATVHNEIDDALEMDGGSPKFYDGPLYRVRINDERQAIVILPAEGVEMPDESNWKTRDRWYSVSGGVRLQTAVKRAAEKADDGLYQVYDCSNGDLSIIAPLPDPGPEPMWHSKGLRRNFENLYLDNESVMEELAGLEHVNKDYLNFLYSNDAERKLGHNELIDLIRHNKPLPETAVGDDSYEDEDDDEDEGF
ncbi:MAG: hypothetical protein H6658_19040 [Ardenticatenaceae bacterium]|nr:hypothetical protein [Ardenticatenaceae bacterium]